MRIKFSEPKKGETRYLAFFAKHYFDTVILQKVRITEAGRMWFRGEVLDVIAGPEEYADKESKTTGDYPYYCFLESLSDAKKVLIYAVLEDDDFFYRGGPPAEIKA